MSDFNMRKSPPSNFNELMNHFVDSINVGLSCKDEFGVYMGCNLYFSQIAGLDSASNIVGKVDLDLSWRDYAPVINKTDIEVLSLKKPIQVKERLLTVDNQIKTFLVNKSFFVFDQKNMIVSNYIDITYILDGQDQLFMEERKELEDQRNNIQIHLENIISNFPAFVYWKDRNGVILGCNDLLAQSVGYSKATDIIGKTDYELSWKDQADAIRENDQQVMKAGKVLVTEESGRLSNGREVVAITHKVPMYDQHHQVIGVIGISLDITDLKHAQEREKDALGIAALAQAKAQAQEEIQRAIFTFTGTMSHDLRTPLCTTGLLTYLLAKNLPILLQIYNEHVETQKKLLGDDYFPEINKKMLKDIEAVPQQLSEINKQSESYIDATLKIIKGAATGVDIISPEDLVACSIEEIIRRVIGSYPCNAEDKEKIHSDTMESFTFRGNSIFMARITENLIKNAFEQIHLKGRGEIFIICEEGDPFNYLKIKDTAGGVPASVAEHLFDGFNSTKKSGTGIGLSSAKQIMQAFGGDIECHLVDGDCVEFVLSFPKLDA